jgi:hypothetical protein
MAQLLVISAESGDKLTLGVEDWHYLMFSHIVIAHPVWNGKSDTFDTTTDVLMPFELMPFEEVY